MQEMKLSGQYEKKKKKVDTLAIIVTSETFDKMTTSIHRYERNSTH